MFSTCFPFLFFEIRKARLHAELLRQKPAFLFAPPAKNESCLRRGHRFTASAPFGCGQGATALEQCHTLTQRTRKPAASMDHLVRPLACWRLMTRCLQLPDNELQRSSGPHVAAASVTAIRSQLSLIRSSFAQSALRLPPQALPLHALACLASACLSAARRYSCAASSKWSICASHLSPFKELLSRDH